MKLKKIIGGTVIALSLITLAACGSSSDGNSTLKKIEGKKSMTVATNPEFAPFEFKTLVNGKDTIVGADVELAKAIGKELGVKVKFSAMSFDNTLASLQSGKADLAISGISATKERQKVYDFSDSYYDSVNVVIVRKADADKYTSTNSFKNLQVGTQKGTIQEAVAKEQLTGSKVVTLVQNGEMISELKNKKLDAVVLEKPIAQGYVAKNNDLVILDKVKLKSGDSDSYAIAMPKGSTALKAKVNKVVKKLKSSGQIDKFIEEAYQQSIKD